MTKNTISLIPSGKERRRLKKRHFKEKAFRLSGIAAIGLSFFFLALLLTSIFSRGLSAFTETDIRLSITFAPEILGVSPGADSAALAAGDYDALVKDALKRRFPEVQGRTELMALYRLASKDAGEELKSMVQSDPSLLGTTRDIWLLASSKVDMVMKGTIKRELPPEERPVTDTELAWIDALIKEESLRRQANSYFFRRGDSREPEQVGILGGIIGSLLTIIVCMAVAFPVGVITAVYLEEFAKQNKFTDILEVNINNLAAVPSIVFGLLGLAVFLGFFGLPRGSALVGGLTLSLMILPTIIIATRNSLKSVPPSIRQAAMGLGASPVQVVVHHVLPLAMPGIMTGTILGIARALGETAPLLMIGMVAFVVDLPSSFTAPASVMPVAIYLWADSPELGFQEKTAAAIIVLLVILIAANAVAAWVRKKYERKW